MNEQAIWCRNPKAVSAEVGDEVIFLHEADGVYYSLDAVGAFVWQSLAEPITLGELMGLIRAEYEVDEELLRNDLQSLAEELVSRQLLDIQEEG